MNENFTVYDLSATAATRADELDFLLTQHLMYVDASLHVHS